MNNALIWCITNSRAPRWFWCVGEVGGEMLQIQLSGSRDQGRGYHLPLPPGQLALFESSA